MWLLMKLLKHASLKFPKAGNLGPGSAPDRRSSRHSISLTTSPIDHNLRHRSAGGRLHVIVPRS